MAGGLCTSYNVSMIYALAVTGTKALLPIVTLC